MLIKLKRLELMFEVGGKNNKFGNCLRFSTYIRYEKKAYKQFMFEQREKALLKYIASKAKPIKQNIRAKGNIIIGN